MSSSNHSKMNPFIHTKVSSLFHAKVNSFFHARGQLWKMIFLQRKVTKGEGDHFPAVLIRTFKYCESLEAKVDWDNVLLNREYTSCTQHISFEKKSISSILPAYFVKYFLILILESYGYFRIYWIPYMRQKIGFNKP